MNCRTLQQFSSNIDTFIDFWPKLLFFRVLFILPEVNIRYSKDPNGTNDAEFNSKRGIYAALFFWVSAGMTIMPDGPFLRPHPLIWRAAFAFSIVYELFLIYTLFQVSLSLSFTVKVS